MTAEDWARLKVCFSDAVAAGPALRRGMVDRLRLESPGLAQELESLLAAHEAHSLDTEDLTLRSLPVAELFPDGLAPGSVIGPYRILRELGRGGSGMVLLAERSDDEFHRPVALKLLRYGLAGAEGQSGLTAERGSLARMQHGNIAILLDWGSTADGLSWLATEFVSGEHIDAWCRAHELDERAILALFAQVADAVAYAHSRGVVHRDLKPGNILVSQEGVVKLLDFGISQPSDAGHDRAAALKFTPLYASPEQLAGEPATPASDVYSLGMVLGQLLSGALPPDLSRIAPGLAAILRHATNAKAAHRYATVAAFQADLNRYLRHLPPLECPTPWPRRVALFGRRNRRAATLAGLAAALTATAAFWLWKSAPTGVPAPRRTPPALAFAARPVGSASPARSLRVSFPQAAVVASVAVVTQGRSQLDFTSDDADACIRQFAPRQGCVLHVRFSPTRVGPRYGAVVLRDAAGHALSTQYIDGVGAGPLPPLPAGPPVRTISGLVEARGLSTDAAGNAFFVDTRAGILYELPDGSPLWQVVAHMDIPNGATAVDGAGNLYAVSSSGQIVYQVVNREAVAIADLPSSVHADDNLEVDGAGNLYASGFNGEILMIAAGTHRVTQLFPGHVGYRFVAMASDLAGNLFCADYYGNALYELPVNKTGMVSLVPPDGYLSHPHAIALDAAGGILVGNNVPDGHILRYAPGTLAVSVLPLLGTQGLAFDGNFDLFAILNDRQVVEYSPQLQHR